MNQRHQIRMTVAALLAIAFIFIGFYVMSVVHKNHEREAQMNNIHGTYFSSPKQIAAFKLEDTDGQSYTEASLKGHWTMMFFGFTNCGSICPTTMAELGKMYRDLAQDDRVALPKVYLISIDGERDTSEKLSQYVKAFDKNFYGARGSAEEITALTKQFGVFYQKDNSNENYQFQHSGIIVVFNPEGKLVALLTPPQKSQNLSNDFRLISYN